ncbi:hypothetical protein NC653_034997 [Populus alba x Populus x berolinensis]|uniref:Uncharacterized protein n=1 Tax=Populus alba x Populus x berolinensis TaxID=444605 RepID=A0AAD6LQ01_9ROSI|nr:hypothetical protein NC653_034997 [Populus alba x Populus x berolinensis]
MLGFQAANLDQMFHLHLSISLQMEFRTVLKVCSTLSSRQLHLLITQKLHVQPCLPAFLLSYQTLARSLHQTMEACNTHILR